MSRPPVDAPASTVIPPPTGSRRARRLAVLFGVPGLTAAFLLGTAAGLGWAGGRVVMTAMSSPGPLASAGASGGATSGGSSGGASAGTSAEATAAPASATSPPPSDGPTAGFALSSSSLAPARWPVPIRDLVGSVPAWISDLTVVEVPDEQGRPIDWTITFRGPPGIRGWTSALPGYLEARGFSAIATGAAATYTTLRGAGVAATLSDGYGPAGTPAVFVAIRVSVGALTARGFVDDRRGDLARRGCARTDVKVLDPFLAVLRAVGATGVNAGTCRDPGAATGRAYRAFGFVDGDALALADRLMAVYEAAGVRPALSVSADSLWWDLTWSGVQVLVSREHVPVGLGGWDRGSLSYVAIRRDPFAPDLWRVELYLTPLEVGPDGRLLADGPLYPGGR